jgi:PAS domain S-box-containing protein
MFSPCWVPYLARDERQGERYASTAEPGLQALRSHEEISVEAVAACAFAKWVHKGCRPDTALQDWLEAEAELNQFKTLAQRLAESHALLQESLVESSRREEALRRAEERYRSTFDNAVEGIFQTTLEGRFLAANPAMARILGFDSPQELLANISDIAQQVHVTPERRSEFRRLLAEYDHVQGFECQVYRKDGASTWISLTARAVRDERGALLYFEGIAEDVNERKQVEESLRNSESLYHSLVESVPFYIFRKDLKGRFTFGNQAFCASLKTSLPQLLGKTDQDFYPGELAYKYTRDDRCVVETGKVLEAIEEHQDPKGERRNVQVLKTPLFDARGEVVGLQCIFWDVTDRMRAEGELARTQVEFRLARSIQQKLFPSSTPHLPGFDIAVGTFGFDIGGASFPAEAIGGDYYDFIPLLDGSLAIAIGDVSGHGVGPALLMAEVRALLRAFAQTQTDVSTILGLVNRVLVPDIEGDRFITLLLAKLDLRSRTLVYTSAGHATAYLLDLAGRLKQTLPSTSIPLGIHADAEFPASAVIPLQRGDLVLLVTDGVVEARSPDGIAFGAQRTFDLVRVYREGTAHQIVDNLYHGVRAFSRDQPQYDDITATVIKVNANATPSSPAAA